VSEPEKATLPDDEAPLQASVVYRLRPPHGDELGLVTQLVLGARPLMLIHIGLGEDDELEFDVDATGPSTPLELAKTLELLAHVLRAGVEEPEEEKPDEQWVDGRLIVPERPGICVHGVGTTPGLWCSSCNEGPEA